MTGISDWLYERDISTTLAHDDWKNATFPYRSMTAGVDQPRGVLHQRLEHGEFQHARRAPSSRLADLIEHYWYVSWDLRDLPAQPPS
jgi:hypothetical protein